MKIWEYEALRDMRDAIERTIVAEIVALLRERVELSAVRMIEERYARQKGGAE